MFMRRVSLILAAVVTMVPFSSLAQQAGPYKVLQTVKVGGEGGFDYVYADDAGRKLYVPRSGPSGRITVFDLDTLKPLGEIANASAHGVAVDTKTQHGFGSSKPVVMFDAKTLATIKTIDVQGGPDGIMGDPSNGRVYVFSHGAPNVTVIDAKDGSIVGTVDLGGAPEQGVLDGKGRLYIDLEDKGSIAVVDTTTNKVTNGFDSAPAGIARAEVRGFSASNFASTSRLNAIAADRAVENEVAALHRLRHRRGVVEIAFEEFDIVACHPKGAGADGALADQGPDTHAILRCQNLDQPAADEAGPAGDESGRSLQGHHALTAMSPRQGKGRGFAFV